jgi:uncharacterized membrane protein
MSEVEKHVDVNCPVSVVYNQYTQFEEFPRFMASTERVTQLDERTLHWVIDIGGAKREFDTKITEQIPDNRIAWKSIDGKTHAGVVTFHRLDDTRTRVNVQMAYDTEGFAETAADALGVISARVKGDLDRFKQFIEARGQESGGWRGKIDAPGQRR